MKKVHLLIVFFAMMLNGFGQFVTTAFVDSFNRSYALGPTNGALSVCGTCASPIRYTVVTSNAATGFANTAVTTLPDYNLMISRPDTNRVPGRTYVIGSKRRHCTEALF